MAHPIVLKCGSKHLIQGEKTFVMGVINVTPDSFSDGGLFFDPNVAVEQGRQMIAQGADIVDVGGVATSPQAPLVDEAEELRRVLPVIKGLVREGIREISVDTMRASVAEAALGCGASWINDQSAGLADPLMKSVMKHADAVVLMHNSSGRDSGVDAGEHVVYGDIMDTLWQFFAARIEDLAESGISRAKIILDPGVGFGKGLNDSVTIVNNVHRLMSLNCMTLLGLSRKSFLGKLTGISLPHERDFVSLGAQAAAVMAGVNIMRTHNVRAAVEMFKALDLCLGQREKGLAHENLY